MTSSIYPGALDNNASLFSDVSAGTSLGPGHWNNLRDAIMAIELELGLNPKGSAADVAARLAAIGGGGGAGAVTRLGRQVLSATGPFSFTGIAGTYSALRLVVQGRLSSAAGVAYVHVQFNADTGGNYSDGLVFSQAGTPGGGNAAAAVSMRVGYFPDTAASAGVAGMLDLLLVEYAGTVFHKVGRSHSAGGQSGAAANWVVMELAGEWASAAAITRIDTVESFLTGSTAVLYGVS